ncbi:MAG: hemolysin family protein, partial [Nanoarchaeota archaeon]
SRVPVYKGEPDKIIGVIHIKNAFKALAEGKCLKTLKTLIEEPYFVPETKKINTLLRAFQNKKTHMGIAINEYGGFVGIVTVEDVLEELVGEIYDESDTPEVDIRKLNEKEYSVKGDCDIEKFNDEMPFPLPEHDDYLTVAGLLMQRLGRLPQKGDRIKLRRQTLTVTTVHDTKVQRVNVRLHHLPKK